MGEAGAEHGDGQRNQSNPSAAPNGRRFFHPEVFIPHRTAQFLPPFPTDLPRSLHPRGSSSGPSPVLPVPVDAERDVLFSAPCWQRRALGNNFLPCPACDPLPRAASSAAVPHRSWNPWVLSGFVFSSWSQGTPLPGAFPVPVHGNRVGWCNEPAATELHPPASPPSAVPGTPAGGEEMRLV